MTAEQAAAVSKAIIVGVAVFACLWDVFVVWRFGPDASISRVLKAWAYDNPAIAFAGGCLAGHWFLHN